MTTISLQNVLTPSQLGTLQGFRSNVETRLESSTRLSTASKLPEEDQEQYFLKNKKDIQYLIDSMKKTNEVIQKLREQNINVTGQRKTFLGLGSKTINLTEVNEKIQKNLNTPEVIKALTDHGILIPRKPSFPINTAAAPSKNTIFKCIGGGIVTASIVAAAVLFRKPISQNANKITAMVTGKIKEFDLNGLLTQIKSQINIFFSHNSTNSTH